MSIFCGLAPLILSSFQTLYSIRDITSTVCYAPLACSSIMSKKLAEGIGSLVLDVKVSDSGFTLSMNMIVILLSVTYHTFHQFRDFILSAFVLKARLLIWIRAGKICRASKILPCSRLMKVFEFVFAVVHVWNSPIEFGGFYSEVRTLFYETPSNFLSWTAIRS